MTEASSSNAALVTETHQRQDTRHGSPTTRRRRNSSRAALLLQIGLVVVAAGTWETLVATGLIPELYVSKPSKIVAALIAGLVDGPLLHALGITMYETTLGFVIAATLGLVTGVALYEMPLAERVARPFIAAANNMPRLALTPLFVLWFGVGTSARIVLIVSMVFFVVLLNTYAGLQSSDRDHLVLARVLGASRRKMFLSFMLPSAIPSIFVGLQLGLTYSFMGAVIGEMISGGTGLGAQIAVYLTTYSSDKVFADLLLMAIVATVLSALVRLLESSLLRWRRYELQGLTQNY